MAELRYAYSMVGAPKLHSSCTLAFRLYPQISTRNSKYQNSTNQPEFHQVMRNMNRTAYQTRDMNVLVKIAHVLHMAELWDKVAENYRLNCYQNFNVPYLIKLQPVNLRFLISIQST